MRPETTAWGWALPAPLVYSRFCNPIALRFYALAVLMLGIRPDCLRSEQRL